MTIFITPRLVIRQLDPVDFEPYAGLSREMQTLADDHAIRNSLQRAIVKYFMEPEFGVWAVTLEESGDMIGICSLEKIEDAKGEIEIELLGAYGNSGYEDETLEGLISYAFHDHGLKEMICIADTTDDKKLGMLGQFGFEKGNEIIKQGKGAVQMTLLSERPSK